MDKAAQNMYANTQGNILYFQLDNGTPRLNQTGSISKHFYIFLNPSFLYT